MNAFRDRAILMVMNHSRTQRLKPLLDTVPPGFLVDTPWLKARSIDPKSIHDYVARGWLERVVRGVYRRPAPPGTPNRSGESWATLLLSLQRLMGYPVHVGGETALDLTGHAHYLGLGGTRRVHFYGTVPSWLKRVPTPREIVVRPSTLFRDDRVGIEEVDMAPGAPVDIWRWPVQASSPERAILEALDELPRHASFDNLDKIFEGLVSLRPRRLTALLGACRRVKVRRLFFVFADRHAHAWRKHVDAAAIDFGSGPRALVEGGRFHPVYRISVPATLMPAESRAAPGDA